MQVPSKAFAEVVEHETGTPWITAEPLKAMIDQKADIGVLDSRSYAKRHTNSIPTAISVPGQSWYIPLPICCLRTGRCC